MKALQIIERLELIYKYIENECTGTPSEFAGKVHLSRRQLYEYIQYLKDFEVDIKYSKKRHTFYISNNCGLSFNCKIELLSNSKKRSINGGFTFICYDSAFFTHRINLI